MRTFVFSDTIEKDMDPKKIYVSGTYPGFNLPSTYFVETESLFSVLPPFLTFILLKQLKQNGNYLDLTFLEKYSLNYLPYSYNENGVPKAVFPSILSGVSFDSLIASTQIDYVYLNEMAFFPYYSWFESETETLEYSINFLKNDFSFFNSFDAYYDNLTVTFSSKCSLKTKQEVRTIMQNISAELKRIFPVKTNMLCLNSNDISVVNGQNDYTKAYAALNQLFSLSKGEYVFFQFNSNLYGGVALDNLSLSNSYDEFVNIIQGKSTTLRLLSSNFTLSPSNILSVMREEFEYCFEKSIYISNGLNIYYFQDYFKSSIPVDSIGVLNPIGFYVSSTAKLDINSSTKISYDSSNKNVVVPLTDKGIITVNPTGTTKDLGDKASSIVYNEETLGSLLFKYGQTKVKGIEANTTDYFPNFFIDLSLVLPDGSPIYSIESLENFTTPQIGGYFIDVAFNGVSNNISLNGLDFSFDNDRSFNCFKKNSTTNILQVDYLSNAVDKCLEKRTNKLSVAIYYCDPNGNLVKTYFEEYHFSKFKVDVTVKTLNAFFKTDSPITNDLIQIDLILDKEGPTINITSDDFDTYTNSKYELLLRNGTKEKVIYNTNEKLNTISSDSKLSLTISLRDLYEFSSVNAVAPSDLNIFSSFSVVLKRYTFGSVRELGASASFSATIPKFSDFIVNALNQESKIGNISESTSGSLVLALAETSRFNNINELIPFIENINILVQGSVRNLDLTGLFSTSLLELSSFKNVIGPFNSNKHLMWKVFFASGGVNPPTTDLRNLQFNNDGSVKGKFYVDVIFKGGSKISLDSPQTVGNEIVLETPSTTLLSSFNIVKLLDKNNPSTLIYYNPNIEFEVTTIDPQAQKYVLYQSANEESFFKSLSSSRLFNYLVSDDKIRYSEGYEKPNTDPIKMMLTKTFIATDGSNQERPSEELKIPILIRKQPSIPQLIDTSNIINKVVLDDSYKLLGISDQQVQFNTYDGSYDSKLINALEGYFVNMDGKELTMSYKVTTTTNSSEVEAVFSTYFYIDSNIRPSVINNSPINLSFINIASSKITIAGKVVSLADIKNIRRNGVVSNVKPTLKDILEDYAASQKDKVDSNSLKTVLAIRSIDTTLSNENVVYLKTLLGSKYDQNFIDSISEYVKSNYFYKTFDIVIAGKTGLFVDPLKNLFRHVNGTDNGIETLYTYSDEAKLNVTSFNGKKIEYKIGEATNFIEAPLGNNVYSNGKTYVSSTISFMTPQKSEQIVFVRQYNENNTVDFQKSLKIVRIDRASIAPKITYDSIQDDEWNYKNFAKKEVVFKLDYTENVDRFLVSIKNQNGDYVLQETEFENTADTKLISAPVSLHDSIFTLEVKPYDASGRLTKVFKYKALYITQDLSIDLQVKNATKTIKKVAEVNDDSIILFFENQSNKNIVGYKVNVNNSYDLYFTQSTFGDNLLNISHLGGKELVPGNYIITVTPINLLQHNSSISSTVVVNFSQKPGSIKCSIKTYKNNVTNSLNCNVDEYDELVVDSFYYLVDYIDIEGISRQASFKSKNAMLNFFINDVPLEKSIKSNTDVTISVYPCNINGYYDLNNKATVKIKYFNENIVIDSTYYDYLSVTNDKNFMMLIKKHPYVDKIECRLDTANSSFVEVTDNIFVSPLSFSTEGLYTVYIKYTDLSGNTFEDRRVVEYKSVIDDDSLSSIINEVFVDTKNSNSTFFPSFGINFDLFGHRQLCFVNRNDSKKTHIINTLKGVSNIPISLGSSANSGIYSFDVYALSEKTGTFSKFLKSIPVVYVKEAPFAPVISSAFAEEDGKRVLYTNAKETTLNWEPPVDIKYIDKLLLNVYKYEDDSFVLKNEFFLEKTELFKKVAIPSESNSRYRIDLKLLGKNGKTSDVSSLYVYQLLEKPKPLVFTTSVSENEKYCKKTSDNFYQFVAVDSANKNSYEKISKVEIILNNTTSLGVFSLESENSVVKVVNGKIIFNIASESNTTLDLFVVGYDKAMNMTSQSLDVVKKMSIQDFPLLDYQYGYFSKVIDSIKPISLNEKTVYIRRNALVNVYDNLGTIIQDQTKEQFNAIDILFDLPETDFSFLRFEMYALKDDGTEYLFCSGSTFKYQENIKNIKVSLEEYTGETGIDKFKILPVDSNSPYSSSFENIKINIKDMKSGYNKLVLKTVDLSGNTSENYIIPISIFDIANTTPYFTFPKSFFSNTSDLYFEWDITEGSGVTSWETYFAKGIVNSSEATGKWVNIGNQKQLKKKVLDYDSSKKNDYSFFVRGVKKVVSQTGVETIEYTKTGIKYLVLDLEAPGGIKFTNQGFTNVDSYLKWTWEGVDEYDSQGVLIKPHDIAGVLVSLNPKLSLDQWTDVKDNEFISLGQRKDGSYTLYVIPYDAAGNNYEGLPFSNTIVVDTVAPKEVELLSLDVLTTKDTPVISWVKNYNLKSIRWLCLPADVHDSFMLDYSNLNLSHSEELKYIWDISFNPNNFQGVRPEIVNFYNKFNLGEYKNIPIDNIASPPEVVLNKKVGHNGINADGEYYFYVVAEEFSGFYTTKMNWRKIVYDTTLPDVSSLVNLLTYPSGTNQDLRFRSDVLKQFPSIINDKKPIFVMKTGYDVSSVEFIIKNANTLVEYVVHSISNYFPLLSHIQMESGESYVEAPGVKLFEFVQNFNLPEGDYILDVKLKDQAGNQKEFLKLFTILNKKNSLLVDSFEVYIDDINCNLVISQNRNTNTYKIMKTNLNKNASLHYRISGDEGPYSLYIIGFTELDIDKNYEFSVLGYSVIEA